MKFVRSEETRPLLAASRRCNTRLPVTTETTMETVLQGTSSTTNKQTTNNLLATNKQTNIEEDVTVTAAMAAATQRLPRRPAGLVHTAATSQGHAHRPHVTCSEEIWLEDLRTEALGRLAVLLNMAASVLIGKRIK